MMDTLVTRFVENMEDNQALLQQRRVERRMSVRPEVKARGRAGERAGVRSLAGRGLALVLTPNASVASSPREFRVLRRRQRRCIRLALPVHAPRRRRAFGFEIYACNFTQFRASRS